MRLGFEFLEGRDAPAYLASAAGTIYAEGLGEAQPFGPTNVPLSVTRGPDATGDGVPDILVGAGNGGGPAVALLDGASLAVLRTAFVLPESFRGGVNVGADDDHFYAGAGPGGGPVLVTIGADLSVLGSRFVGPADNRSGIIPAGNRVGTAEFSVAGVPYDLSRLGVRAIGPGEPSPSQWSEIRAGLSLLPTNLVRDYLSAGGGIDVTAGPITNDPSVAGLAGLQVERYTFPETYDQIAGVSDINGALVRADATRATVLHEVGHGVDRLVLRGASAAGDWLYVWGSTAWPTEYERLTAEEAWAESFARHLLGLPQPSGAVAAYFQNLFASRGWVA